MKYICMCFRLVWFSTEYLYTAPRKRLSKDLLSMLFPTRLYQSVFSCPSGFQRVRKMPVFSCMKTFFFKLHAEILRANTWLHKKDIFASSLNCPIFDVPETTEHCFTSFKMQYCLETRSKGLCRKTFF